MLYNVFITGIRISVSTISDKEATVCGLMLERKEM